MTELIGAFCIGLLCGIGGAWRAWRGEVIYGRHMRYQDLARDLAPICEKAKRILDQIEARQP